MLSDEANQEIHAYLAEMKGNMLCTWCQRADYGVSSEIMHTPFFEARAPQQVMTGAGTMEYIEPAKYGVIMLVCLECGHTHYFSAGHPEFGLVPE